MSQQTRIWLLPRGRVVKHVNCTGHMIRLKSHSLGGLELGRLAIGALGGDTSRKHAPRDLYKRILTSMPSALREAYVREWNPIESDENLE